VIITLFLRNIQSSLVPLFFGLTIGFIGFLIMLIMYSTNQLKRSIHLILLFSFNFAVSFGFILEFLKFHLKKILHQELTSSIYIFSMNTMTYVIIGAFLSTIFSYLYLKSKLNPFTEIVETILKENPSLKKEENQKEIIELIKKGENEELEFKSTLRYNLHTNQIDKKIEHSTLKTITAFLNTNGGSLLLGITDKGEIIGIEKDNFNDTDKFLLHLNNIIKEKFKKNITQDIEINPIKINNKTIIKINCKKSKEEIFLKNPSQEEEFFIRTGPATHQLKGTDLINYIKKRFKEK